MFPYSDAIKQEPRWLDTQQFQFQRLPPGQRSWLVDRGSLTQGIMKACIGRFQVRLKGQHRLKAFPSEAKLLGCPPYLRSIVREVQLCCDAECWVYARTVIPATSLRGSARRLARLGSRPLGALLFADPSSKRGLIQFATLRPGHGLFELAVTDLPVRPLQLQARRTLFHFAGKPLLVNEVFLPEIPVKLEGRHGG